MPPDLLAKVTAPLVSMDDSHLAALSTTIMAENRSGPLEVTRFFASLATDEEGRYTIRAVMGLDEYHDGYPDRAEPDLGDSDMKDLRAGATTEGVHLGAMAGVAGLFATSPCGGLQCGLRTTAGRIGRAPTHSAGARFVIS